MKKCARCKEVLPFSEFNKKAKLKDGLDSYCRKCASAFYHESNERFRQSGAKRQVPKQRLYEYQRQYAAQHPRRIKAKDLLSQAIKSGKISRISTQLCATCGVQAQDYHHSDYTKPYEVTPLCKSCHRKWHQENKPIEAV